MGAQLPASCTAGEMFFKTTAPTLHTLHVCTAANTWRRVSNSGVSVLDFGAKCDGQADDSAAFQAAHDAAIYGGTITIPSGMCRLNHDINITKDNFKLRGSGQGSTYLQMGPAVTKLFNVTNKTSTALVLPEFSDFTVDGSKAPAGVAFYINGVRSVHIERIYTVRCFISYFVDKGPQTTNTFHLSHFMIEDTPDLPGARGILLNGGGDDWFISDGRLFEVNQGKSNIGMELRSGGGFMFDRIDISSYGRALVVDPPAGSFVRFGQINALQCDTSWGDNAILDGTAAHASGYPNGIYNLHFVNSWFSSAGVNGGNGNGINIAAAQGIVIDASQFYSNSLNGIRIQAAAHDITISHSQISSNSNGYGNKKANTGHYSGIAVDANTAGFTLDGNKSGVIGYNSDNQQYGISIAAGCNFYRVIGNDLTNNLKGPYSDLSLANSQETQVMGNVPAAVNNVMSGAFFAKGIISGSAFVSSGGTYKGLGTPPNGTIIYCSDCAIAPVCSAGGRGAIAKRLNNAWVCN